MWGAGIATIFYGFSCDQKLRLSYGAAVRVCLSVKRVQELKLFQISCSALFCMLLTLGPHFDSSHFRRRRPAFYAVFGLSFVTFVIHGIILYGWEMQKSRMSLIWMGWMAMINLFGATIYATRVFYPVALYSPSTDTLQIPERWAPYAFDTFGASHQIFHITVMVAAWVHYAGLLESFGVTRDVNHSCRVSPD